MPYNFGGYLGSNVLSSGLDESPFYHIDTVLKDGRTFTLWFSSAADGRKSFGIHLELPWKRPAISNRRRRNSKRLGGNPTSSSVRRTARTGSKSGFLSITRCPRTTTTA